jgi:hypothetical protein
MASFRRLKPINLGGARCIVAVERLINSRSRLAVNWLVQFEAGGAAYFATPPALSDFGPFIESVVLGK